MLNVLGTCVNKVELMLHQVREIFFGLRRSGGTQTLIILDPPSLAIVVSLLPRFVFVQSEESLARRPFGDLCVCGEVLLGGDAVNEIP